MVAVIKKLYFFPTAKQRRKYNKNHLRPSPALFSLGMLCWYIANQCMESRFWHLDVVFTLWFSSMALCVCFVFKSLIPSIPNYLGIIPSPSWIQPLSLATLLAPERKWVEKLSWLVSVNFTECPTHVEWCSQAIGGTCMPMS